MEDSVSRPDIIVLLPAYHLVSVPPRIGIK
jgi:hypothetical protein